MSDGACTRCGGSGHVPVYAHSGSAPCPRCSGAPSPLDDVRDVPLCEGAAILVGPEGAQIVRDPEAVLVAGVRADWRRIDELERVLRACREHGMTPGEWLRRARHALTERLP